MKIFVRIGDICAILVLIVFMGAVASHFAYPVGYWIDVRSVSVENGIQGRPLKLLVDRSIRREFAGHYNVYIRSLPGQTAYCEAEGSVHYLPDAVLPDPVTMTWWAYSDDRCHGPNFPPGVYVMKTCWTVELVFWLDRRICIDSPAFVIKEQPKGEVADGHF